MEPEGSPSDELSGRLAWSQDGPSDPLALAEQPGLAALENAVTAVTVRLDALSTATATFRTLISDRLTDYFEQTARVQATAGRDLDDARKEHERTLDEIERALNESDEGFLRLHQGMDQILGQINQSGATTAQAVAQSADALRAVLEERTKDVAAEVRATRDDIHDSVTQLEDSTAGALTEVATRLERLAQAADDRIEAASEIAETVAVLARRAEIWSTENGDRGRQVAGELAAVRAGVEALAARDDRSLGDQVKQVLVRLGQIEHLVAQTVDAPPAAAVVESLAAIQRLAEDARRTSDQRFESLTAALHRVEELTAERPDVTPILGILERLEAPIAETGGAQPSLEEQRAMLGSLQRVEEVVGAIAEAAEDASLLPQIEERFDALDGAVDSLVEAHLTASSEPTAVVDALERIDRQLSELGARTNDGPETTARLARLEELVGRLASTDDRPEVQVLGRLEDAIDRLAAAQAEDLEHVLGALADRFDRAPDAVPGADRRSPAAEESVVLEQLQKLGDQIEGLRRRIALRGRPAPALDEATVGALADAVAARLEEESPTPARPPSRPLRPRPVTTADDPPARTRVRTPKRPT